MAFLNRLKILNPSGTPMGDAAVPVRTDTTGTTTQPVSAATLPLPAGAATQATLALVATEATLSTLNTKVTAVDTGAVVVSSSALPTGASTSANQTTEITKLTSIDTKTPTQGQTTMAASSPVVIASDQSAIPVSGSFSVVGGATSVKQSDGSQKTQVVDSVGTSVSVTGTSLNVNITGGAGSGGTALADKGTFTEGTTLTTTISGEFQDTPTDPAAGQIGAVRITAKRGLHVNLRKADGTEKIAQTTMAASIPVVIASDQTAIPVSGTVTTSSPIRTKVILTVAVGGAAGAGSFSTMDINKGGTVTSAALYTVTAGKTLRIQTIIAADQSTSGVTTIIKIREAAALLIGSPLIFQASMYADASTSNGPVQTAIPDGLEVAAVQQIGLELAGAGSEFCVIAYEY